MRKREDQKLLFQRGGTKTGPCTRSKAIPGNEETQTTSPSTVQITEKLIVCSQVGLISEVLNLDYHATDVVARTVGGPQGVIRNDFSANWQLNVNDTTIRQPYFMSYEFIVHEIGKTACQKPRGAMPVR